MYPPPLRVVRIRRMAAERPKTHDDAERRHEGMGPSPSPSCPPETRMNRIDATFSRLKREGRRALMPFLTAGDPDIETTRALIKEVVAQGASLVEVGLPYSDPIADGPVIAASYTRALRKGIRQSEILAMARSLRDEGALGEAPLVAMGSYAIFHRQGVEAFLAKVAAAGFDGLIVPDLPVEESAGLAKIASCVDSQADLSSSRRPRRDRAVQITRSTTGFIYYVSVAGIHGRAEGPPPELAANVASPPLSHLMTPLVRPSRGAWPAPSRRPSLPRSGGRGSSRRCSSRRGSPGPGPCC